MRFTTIGPKEPRIILGLAGYTGETPVLPNDIINIPVGACFALFLASYPLVTTPP